MAKAGARSNVPDISALGLEELRELRQTIEERITYLEEEFQREVYQQMQELASRAGTTVEKLLQQYGASRRGQKGRKTGKDAKFQNPGDPTQTWSGRGRKPNWLNEALASGKRLEDFTIS
jgi:DNA-binding protein H-NS